MSETISVKELIRLAKEAGAGLTGRGKTFELDFGEGIGTAVFINNPSGIKHACIMLERLSQRVERGRRKG